LLYDKERIANLFIPSYLAPKKYFIFIPIISKRNSYSADSLFFSFRHRSRQEVQTFSLFSARQDFDYSENSD